MPRIVNIHPNQLLLKSAFLIMYFVVFSVSPVCESKVVDEYATSFPVNIHNDMIKNIIIAMILKTGDILNDRSMKPKAKAKTSMNNPASIVPNIVSSHIHTICYTRSNCF